VTMVSDVMTTEESVTRPNKFLQSLRVTWLLHRGALVGLFALFAAVVIAMVVAGTSSRAQYSLYVNNHCITIPRQVICANIFNWFASNSNGATALVIAVSAMPAVVGVFVGAPMLSREFEAGTFRFTFTQSVGRSRFVLTALVMLATVVVAISVASGIFLSWLVHPLEVIGDDDRWQAGLFNTSSLMLASWTVFALSVGVYLGAVVKRVVSSMAAAIVVVGGFFIASFQFILKWMLSIGTLTVPHLLPNTGIGNLGEAARDAPGAPKGSWLIRGWFVDFHGHVLGASAVRKIEKGLYRPHGKGFNVTHWLSLHHVVYDVSYQPASRFLTFQIGAAAILVVLACVFAVLTLRRIRSV
jgi:ABC-type transport system involved in multi-copper enzyme maturation permease subunit